MECMLYEDTGVDALRQWQKSLWAVVLRGGRARFACNAEQFCCRGQGCGMHVV